MSFTLIFEGDIADFEGNPFHTDTPFGKPCGASMGDLMEESGRYWEALNNIAAIPTNTSKEDAYTNIKHAVRTAKAGTVPIALSEKQEAGSNG